MEGLSRCARVGLTAVHDMGTTPDVLAVLRALEEEGALTVRVFAYLAYDAGLIAQQLQIPPDRDGLLQVVGVKLFADGKNTEALKGAVGSPSLAAYLKAHLDRLGKGDYLGLLAYVEMKSATEEVLQAARHRVRDRKKVATCLGFGPRFLHSTGQAYKGGPNSGVFLQLTCDDARDLPVPGQRYSFGVVKAAQARGDYQVLAERGRRALRVHLPANLGQGLAALAAAFERALA